MTKEELRRRLVEKDWQYSRRQMTWFRRNPDIHWCDPSEPKKIIDLAENFLHL